MSDVARRAAQEVEIDHLLEEEFLCDPSFATRLLQAAGIEPEAPFEADAAVAEPSLGGDGYGDLLVTGSEGGRRSALLIEDKITAAAGPRQAERYASHAARMRDQGWTVRTLLLAPASYRGERGLYDGHVALETVASLLFSVDPTRLAHRRGIIERALAKRAATGVRNPDARLHALKAAYLDHVTARAAAGACAYGYPALRAAYYDGDSWMEGITHPSLPTGHVLRHRLWTDIAAATGRVDLIAARADAATRDLFDGIDVPGATVAPFSKGRGVLASLAVPEMRQAQGFDPAIADAALEAMDRLVAWRSGAT